MPDAHNGLSAESITAIAAVVTALIALAVGVWENVQNRRHARLSSIPSLDYIVELTSGDDDASPDGVPGGVIRVANQGVGPAVIDSVRIRLDRDGGEEVYSTWTEAEPVLEELGIRITGRAEVSDESVMGVGRDQDLVAFELQEDEDRSIEVVYGDLLERMTLVIAYRSIYGQGFEAVLGGPQSGGRSGARFAPGYENADGAVVLVEQEDFALGPFAQAQVHPLGG